MIRKQRDRMQHVPPPPPSFTPGTQKRQANNRGQRPPSRDSGAHPQIACSGRWREPPQDRRKISATCCGSKVVSLVARNAPLVFLPTETLQHGGEGRGGDEKSKDGERAIRPGGTPWDITRTACCAPVFFLRTRHTWVPLPESSGVPRPPILHRVVADIDQDWPTAGQSVLGTADGRG